MQKRINLKFNIIFKNILFYIFSFIVSLIFIKKIPVGAIALFTCIYSAGFILTPTILISIFSGIILGNAPFMLIYLFYVLLFIAFTILIKPLVAVHDIFEKLKVEKYLLFICFYLNIFVLDFANSLFITLLTFSLYKFIVNTLPIIKNEKEKMVFSNDEITSFYIFLIFLFEYFIYILNIYLKINIKTSFIISSIFSAFMLGCLLFKTTIIYTFIAAIFYSLSSAYLYSLFPSTINISLNLLVFNLFLYNIESAKKEKNKALISLIIYTICMSLFFITYKNWYNLVILISINIPAYLYFINKKVLFSGFFLKSNLIPQSLDKNFSYTNDPKYNFKIIYDLNKFNEFKNEFYNDEEQILKNNPVFEEIKINDDIIKWIFYNINNYNSFDIRNFFNILNENNILLPKDNDTFLSFISDIEKYSINISNKIIQRHKS